VLIRAFWALDEDWEAREIEAQLHLRHADGSREVLSQTKLVAGPSTPQSLADTFHWGLDADTVEPGLRYHVSLWETADDDTDEASEGTRIPAEGDALVGVESSRLALHVVLVPFIVQSGCGASPDTSEETLQAFHDALYMMTPIDELKLEVRDTVVWTEPLANVGELMVSLRALRFEDGAPPEAFYYGLVELCGNSIGGLGALPADPASPDAAHERIALGQSGDAGVFVHEIGHNLGRFHIGCGIDTGWDATYPHADGSIGEWGFGVVDFQLRHPTVHKDFMSYCHPQWVGAWGWNRMFAVIGGINSWANDSAGGRESHAGSLLVGLIEDSGDELWQTVPGSITSHAPADGQKLEFASGGVVLGMHQAYVSNLADGAPSQRILLVELPANFDEATTITRVDGDERKPIDLAKVRRLTDAPRPKMP
jgi:hypothetical protein